MLWTAKLMLLGTILSAGTGTRANSPLLDDIALQNAGMFRYWQAYIPLAPGDSLKEAHLVDQALYVITDLGTLFALAADTGLLRWGVKLTEPNYKIHRPAHILMANGAGPVVVSAAGRVFVIDRFSGDLIQSFTTEFPVGSAAVGYDDRLFLGSADGRFYSLKLDLQQRVAPYKLWEVLVGGAVTAAPILYDGRMLLFAVQNGAVYSCRAEDKTLNWVFHTGGPILCDPAIDDDAAYVASTDRSLYKLRLVSGRLLWRVRMPRPLATGPVVVADTVFQYCPGNGIIAFDAETGRQKWRRSDGITFVAHNRNGDVIFTEDGRLELLDNKTGEPRHTIAAPAVAAAVVNPRDDAVYLLGKDGSVLCARVDSVPYLRRQQVIAARRMLHRPPPESSTKTAPEQLLPFSRTGPHDDDLLRSRHDTRP